MHSSNVTRCLSPPPQFSTLLTAHWTVMILVGRFLFLHVRELLMRTDGRRQCVVLKTAMIIERGDEYRARLRLESQHRKLASRGKQNRERRRAIEARHRSAPMGSAWDDWLWPRWGEKKGV